jgi:hypothetical protein
LIRFLWFDFSLDFVFRQMTNRGRAIGKWLALSAVAAILIGFGLALDQGHFYDFSARGTQNETGGTQSKSANGKIAHQQSLNGISSIRLPRSPTVIGDMFEAFGKPADVEVCGFGVQHVEEFPKGISSPPVTASNETLNTAARNLANSKVDVERALGLYLQAKLAGDAALERAQIQEPGCGQPNSASSRSKPCSADYSAGYQTARMAGAKPLIEMARATTDPDVYATAYYFCESAPRDARGACAPISAAGWARLDPENIFPQLLVRSPGPYVGGLAKMPADNPPNDSPLPTARYDRRTLRFDRVMSQDVFKQEPLYMQTAITQSLIGEHFAPDSRAIQAIYAFCRPAEISRATRSQTCSDLIELMGSQGKSYMDLSLALKLGADGRLPDAQLAKLREEDANYLSHVGSLANGTTGYSCDGMAITVKHFADAFARGERAIAAEGIAPKSMAKP